MLALFYAMAVSSAGQKSMTFDELAHLTAGYTYWAFDDYRLHPENGNWPQRLAALPAVLGGASFPPLDQPAWRSSDVYTIGDQFLYSSGNDAGALLSRGRAVMALVGIALGALVYAWARRLVSPAGAWVSLLLFVFSPTLLAHAPLVTSDMTSALFFTAATGALWVVLHRATPATVTAAGILTGGTLVSKLSGPILLPVAIALLVVRLVDGRPLAAGVGHVRDYHGRMRQLAVLLGAGALVAFLACAVVWASFGFRYTAFAAATTGAERFLGDVAEPPGAAGRILATARRLRLLPEAYLYGLGFAQQTASERAAFLRGEFSTTGWWWYFPYAFVVKTTIPAMAVGLLALVALVVRWRRARDAALSVRACAWQSVYAGTPLVVLIVVYAAFALATNLNIGHRHLLPIYPALCILAGGAAFWIGPLVAWKARPAAQSRRGQRRGRGPASDGSDRFVPPRAAGMAIVALLAWHAVESLAIRPSYLAYVNQLAGGPSQGYRHLADSSLDWGQDLPALATWLGANAPRQPDAGGVYLSYFGTARPEYYGVRATALAGFIDRRPVQPPDRLEPGLYCVSATMLNVVGRVLYGPDSERRYQAALQDLAALGKASESEQAWSALMSRTGDRYWQELFADFDRLRTGRLLAFLRGREPDAMAGYTILIYRLTEADVEQALFGRAQ
jgi:hypothetical protein